MDTAAAKSSKDESTNQEPNADLISSNSGSAGGYVGYGCGVQIADSDVIGLRATDVAAPDPLRSEKGESYFGADSMPVSWISAMQPASVQVWV